MFPYICIQINYLATQSLHRQRNVKKKSLPKKRSDYSILALHYQSSTQYYRYLFINLKDGIEILLVGYIITKQRQKANQINLK